MALKPLIAGKFYQSSSAGGPAPTHEIRTTGLQNPGQTLTTTLTPDSNTSLSIDPVSDAGVWIINGYIHIKMNGATFAGYRVLQAGLYDLALNTSWVSPNVLFTPLTTTSNESMPIIPVFFVLDTTSILDPVSFTVAASIQNLPSAGTIRLEDWNLTAVKL